MSELAEQNSKPGQKNESAIDRSGSKCVRPESDPTREIAMRSVGVVVLRDRERYVRVGWVVQGGDQDRGTQVASD
jgi:hypothetical protein